MTGASPLQIRSLEQVEEITSPQRALAQLAFEPLTPYRKTNLSESPFWFSFTVPAIDQAAIVELPSRHASEAACWRADDLRPLGWANRTSAMPPMMEVKTGFALNLGKPSSAISVVCRASHTGPAYISATLWPAEQFQLSELKFHRNSGLLEGGLIILSLFVLMTAVINRAWLYVLFAVWLLANLRLAALSAGWDTQWLERLIPPDWFIPMRKFTMAAYYVLTITLFSRLFADDLRMVKNALLMRVNQWSCVPLLLASLVFPYAIFLPILWVFSACATTVIIFLLVRIMIVTRSKAAMWYGAGVAIALLGSVSEILAAALGYRHLIGSVNNVTGALSSSLLSSRSPLPNKYARNGRAE